MARSNNKTLSWSLHSISIFLFIYLFTFVSVNIFIYLSIYLSLYRSIYLSLYRSIYLSIYLTINLCICLSIYLSIYLSICLSFSYISSKLSNGIFLKIWKLLIYYSFFQIEEYPVNSRSTRLYAGMTELIIYFLSSLLKIQNGGKVGHVCLSN